MKLFKLTSETVKWSANYFKAGNVGYLNLCLIVISFTSYDVYCGFSKWMVTGPFLQGYKCRQYYFTNDWRKNWGLEKNVDRKVRQLNDQIANRFT